MSVDAKTWTLATQSDGRRYSRPSRGELNAFDFYISPTGAGDAATGGTLANPWPISMLNDTAARTRYAGKRVGLLDGVYNLRLLTPQPYPVGNTRSILEVAGGPSNAERTVIEAVNRHGAILDCDRPGFFAANPGASWRSAAIGTHYASNVTLRGFRVIRAHYSGVQTTVGSNLTLDSIWVDDQVFNTKGGIIGGENSGAFILLGAGDGPVQNAGITNCKVTNSGAPADGSNGQFIHRCVQAFRCLDCVVEYCTFIGASGGGADGVWWKNTENRRNTIRNCFIDMAAVPGGIPVRWSIFGDSAADLDVLENNVLIARGGFTTSTVGIVFAYEWLTNTGPSSIRMAHNTAVGLETMQNLYRMGGNQGIQFYNNVLWRQGRSNEDVALHTLTQLSLMDYNAWGNTSVAPVRFGADNNFPNGIAAWRTLSGRSANDVEITASPFTNAGTDAARYQIVNGNALKTLGRVGGVPGGAVTEVGAWGNGAAQVGSDF